MGRIQGLKFLIVLILGLLNKDYSDTLFFFCNSQEFSR